MPKELEDHVVYENDRPGSLLSTGAAEKVTNVINKGAEMFKKNKILNKIGSVFKSNNPGSNYTNKGKVTATEANSDQMKAMNDAKMKKMEDDKVKEKKKIKEDMKGMSQKSGDKRSTESGAGMTAKGVAKYNRRTGGDLKTAVTTPPSKLKAGSKAAGRRKSFCARSKSWTGPRGKAARRRWNCEFEPELPMIPESKKKLYNTSPLSTRVSNWSKSIKEGDSYVKSDRNKFGLPKDLKSVEKKVEKKTTGVNYGAMAQSYVPQGEMIDEIRTNQGMGDLAKKMNLDPTKPGDYMKLKRLLRNQGKDKAMLSMGEAKMTSPEKKKKEDYVKGMKKDKGGFTKRYGKDGESVMYATATKMAMKEGSCGEGEYYCNDDQKCKPIPDGYKEGKDGMLVKEAKTDRGKSESDKRNNRNQRAFGNRRNANYMQGHEDAERRRYNTKKGRGVKTKGQKDKRPMDYHTRDKDARLSALFKSKGIKYPERKPSKDDKYRTEDFYRKKYDVKDGGYKKTTKMDKSNKRAGDSKAQYRQVHKDLAKENVLTDFLKKAKGTVNKYNSKLKQNNDAINSVLPGSASLSNEEGNLRSWFKGSKSKDGKGGWVNVVTGGTCASDKPGEGTPKCVSSSKRASMSKAERLSASRRKKKADPGQQSKSGAAKPTYVATDKKKKVDEMNQGPSTPVGNYDGKIMQKVGAAGIGKIRPKDGKTIADLLKKV